MAKKKCYYVKTKHGKVLIPCCWGTVESLDIEDCHCVGKNNSNLIIIEQESELVQLLKDCKYPIQHIHDGNHDESKLLARIDVMINKLGGECPPPIDRSLTTKS